MADFSRIDSILRSFVGQKDGTVPSIPFANTNDGDVAPTSFTANGGLTSVSGASGRLRASSASARLSSVGGSKRSLSAISSPKAARPNRAGRGVRAVKVTSASEEVDSPSAVLEKPFALPVSQIRDYVNDLGKNTVHSGTRSTPAANDLPGSEIGAPAEASAPHNTTAIEEKEVAKLKSDENKPSNNTPAANYLPSSEVAVDALVGQADKAELAFAVADDFAGESARGEGSAPVDASAFRPVLELCDDKSSVIGGKSVDLYEQMAESSSDQMETLRQMIEGGVVNKPNTLVATTVPDATLGAALGDTAKPVSDELSPRPLNGEGNVGDFGVPGQATTASPGLAKTHDLQASFGQDKDSAKVGEIDGGLINATVASAEAAPLEVALSGATAKAGAEEEVRLAGGRSYKSVPDYKLQPHRLNAKLDPSLCDYSFAPSGKTSLPALGTFNLRKAVEDAHVKQTKPAAFADALGRKFVVVTFGSQKGVASFVASGAFVASFCCGDKLVASRCVGHITPSCPALLMDITGDVNAERVFGDKTGGVGKVSLRAQQFIRICNSCRQALQLNLYGCGTVASYLNSSEIAGNAEKGGFA